MPHYNSSRVRDFGGILSKSEPNKPHHSQSLKKDSSVESRVVEDAIGGCCIQDVKQVVSIGE